MGQAEDLVSDKSYNTMILITADCHDQQKAAGVQQITKYSRPIDQRFFGRRKLSSYATEGWRKRQTLRPSQHNIFNTHPLSLHSPPLLLTLHSSNPKHHQPRGSNHQTNTAPNLHPNEIRPPIRPLQQRTRNRRSYQRRYTRHTPTHTQPCPQTREIRRDVRESRGRDCHEGCGEEP
jgi:hypothetical protein